MDQTGKKLTAAILLNEFDWGDLVDIGGGTSRWFGEIKGDLNVQSEGFMDLTRERFNSNRIRKETLAGWLEDASEYMQRQMMVIERFKNIIDLMKTEAIADKTKVIKAQEQLLESQNDQLGRLKSAVESTVQDTVQKEIKSYSEAVTNQSSETGSQIQDSLRKAVKSAIDEDDRSKNLVIFGLDEGDKEQIHSKVAELFSELGETPRVSASRIGTMRTNTSLNRPVKVTLTNSTAVRQILAKSRQLKLSDNYQSVFICPDRSPEERAARRALVLELKSAAAKQPDCKHFIKNGQVHSERIK